MAFADAAARNSQPILGALMLELRHCRRVLEIGSGTGQHAVAFAQAMPRLTWQTSDLIGSHDSIHQYIASAGVQNALPPLLVDVRTASLPSSAYDAVFTANTMHIMSYQAVGDMLALAGSVLEPDGVFCAYGPFRRNGGFSTPSNAGFDASLRARDPEMGIRDLEDVDELAADNGLRLERIYAMPANNLMPVWRRLSAGDDDGDT